MHSGIENDVERPLSPTTAPVEPTRPPWATPIGLDPKRAPLDDRVPRAGPPVACIVLILVASVGLFVYSAHEEVILGQIAVPLLAIGGLHGLLRGGFRKIVTLTVMIGVCYAISQYPDFADPIVRLVRGSSSPIANGALAVVSVILALVLTGLCVSSFHRRHIARRPVALAADRVTGAVIGLAEGGLVVLCLCWMAVMVRPHVERVLDHPNTMPDSFQHQVAQTLVGLAEESQGGAFGRFVAATNLLEKSPAWRATVEELNATGTLRLEGLDPETTERLNAVIPQLTGGRFQSLDQLLEAYQRGGQAANGAHPPPASSETP